MKKEIIYSSGNYLRDEFKIEGYLFGKQSEGSEPAACIVGAMRGNEYQQLYICSQLVKRLKNWRTAVRSLEIIRFWSFHV